MDPRRSPYNIYFLRSILHYRNKIITSIYNNTPRELKNKKHDGRTIEHCVVWQSKHHSKFQPDKVVFQDHVCQIHQFRNAKV